MKSDTLARRIQEMGFSCTQCGTCCRGMEGDANLVMVSPGELDCLVLETKQDTATIAEPYPDRIETSDGGSITFEWCLRRHGSNCIFLEEDRCTVYGARPWICRTYPFMLDEEHLMISPCEGIGRDISQEEAGQLVRLLLQRRQEEQQEEELVRNVLANARIPPGKRVLIDSRGVRLL
jgi:Fe-S-cluster containining protein